MFYNVGLILKSFFWSVEQHGGKPFINGPKYLFYRFLSMSREAVFDESRPLRGQATGMGL